MNGKLSPGLGFRSRNPAVPKSKASIFCFDVSMSSGVLPVGTRFLIISLNPMVSNKWLNRFLFRVFPILIVSNKQKRAVSFQLFRFL